MQQSEPLQKEEFIKLLETSARVRWKQQVNDLKAELMAARGLGDNDQVQKLLETFSKLKQEAKSRGLV